MQLPHAFRNTVLTITASAALLFSLPVQADNSADLTSLAKPTCTHPVPVNQTDVHCLMTVHGIGQATAERIVSYRETNGPFTTLDDLIKIRGISQNKLNKWIANNDLVIKADKA